MTTDFASAPWGLDGQWIGLDAEAEAALPPPAAAAYSALREAALHAATCEALFDRCTMRVVELVALGREISHQINTRPKPSFMQTWESDLRGRR